MNESTGRLLSPILFPLFRALLRGAPWKKGKQTLAHHFFQNFLKGTATTLTISFHHLKLRLRLADRIQSIFYFTDLYEPQTVAEIIDSLPMDEMSVFVDVGANTGLIALQILVARPLARCHLFEADPTIFEELSERIELNGLVNVELHHSAVSDGQAQRLSFQRSTNLSESGWGRVDYSGGPTKVEVPAISIDQFMQTNKLDRITVMKIDVEGGEERVLRGAALALSQKRIKAIICEINEDALNAGQSSAARIFKILEDYGYRRAKKMELNYLFLANGLESHL